MEGGGEALQIRMVWCDHLANAGEWCMKSACMGISSISKSIRQLSVCWIAGSMTLAVTLQTVCFTNTLEYAFRCA